MRSKRTLLGAALAVVVVAGVATWAVLGPLRSATSAQAAAPYTVTLTSPNAVAVDQTAQLSGSVSPHSPGTSIDLQIKSGSSWRFIATALLSSNSTYDFAFKQSAPGFYPIRVFKPASSTRAAGSASTT